MINQLINMDRQKPFILACSGGVDSMAIADFYRRGNKNFSIAYFNHGTKQANLMQDFVCTWAKQHGIGFHYGKISRTKFKSESHEEFWRNERYAWLNSFNLPVVTCHHLDDAVETWIFSSLHGNPKLISIVKDKMVYRPFLLNTKQTLIDWCIRHKVNWLEDQSNKDINFPRNRIRYNIMPEILKINPGLYKVIYKKIIKELKA
jgi:tRNA(Ile)-lysidine synthase